MLILAAHPIVHVNATLNALATVLLVLGWWLIKKRGNVDAHKWTMLAAFGVSTVFLVCYLWYHYQVGSVKFTHPGPVRYVYLAILASHVILAATVPVFAISMIYLGFRAIGCCRPQPKKGDSPPFAAAPSNLRADTGERGTVPDDLAAYRAKHRRLARWAYPIWLYVSVTGVVVYVMLYHLWPPAAP
jgi:putative membrane protein